MTLGRAICFALAALITALVSACGGGSAASSVPLPPPGPPLVKASGATPFAANCTPLGGATLYIDAEVEPFVDVDPTNPSHLLGAWQQDRFSNGGARGLVTAVSNDGGLTWARQALPATACAGGAYERASDPWVTYAADGRAYAIALAFDSVGSGDNAVLVYRSLDGGTTWGAAATLIADGAANFNDKEAIAADRGNALYAYAAWDRLTSDNRGPAMFSRTIDGGVTWSTASVIYDPGVGNQTLNVTPIVAPDGTVYVFFTEITGGTTTNLRLMRSTDHGATFTAPLPIDQVLVVGASDPGNGNAIRDGSGLGSIAVGPSGELVVAWQDRRATGTTRDGVLLRRSSNQGTSWTPAVIVNRMTGVQAFTPTVTVRNDGRIGVTHLDMRDDSAGDQQLGVAHWLVTSADGVSWNETRVSQPFDLRLAPVARGMFIGDYMGLTNSGTSFLPFFSQTNNAGTTNRTDIYVMPVGQLTSSAVLSDQVVAKQVPQWEPTEAERRATYDAVMRTRAGRVPNWARWQAGFEAAAARR